MKSNVDKLDTGKLESTLIDLSKIRDVVKNDVVVKTEYDEFVKKVNNIKTFDTSDSVKKGDYDTKIDVIEGK